MGFTKDNEWQLSSTSGGSRSGSWREQGTSLPAFKSTIKHAQSHMTLTTNTNALISVVVYEIERIRIIYKIS